MISPPHAPWKSATQHGLIRTGDIGDDDGLWLCSTNSEPELLLEGRYERAITSLNGDWIIAKKNHGRRGESLVLFDLDNREEYLISLPQENANITAYSDHLNAFLIRVWSDDWKDGEYLALDPQTKETQKIDGVFWPLENLTYRPLQTSKTQGCSWAARYDEKRKATVIGRYDIVNFSYEPVMHVPGLYFNSTDMW